MPELPEVETVVRDLRPLLTGRTILAMRQSKRKLRRPWNPDWNAAVIGTRINAIRRRGKWIVVELVGVNPGTPNPKRPHPPTPSPRGRGGANHSPLSPLERGLEEEGKAETSPRLIVHLGMTGQFTAVPASTPEPDHLHLVFELDNGTELRFRDSRRFGSATYTPDESAVEAFFTENGLGPEPFGLDVDYFRNAIRGTSRNLKAVLLDQGIVTGVGNIYADEACFRAKLHPGRKGKTLKPEECDQLREAVEAVLTKAIESRGSTIRDYVGGSGLRGKFQNEFAVYGRTGKPCPTCATEVKCVRLAGRSSHFCGTCQKLSPQRDVSRQVGRGSGQEAVHKRQRATKIESPTKMKTTKNGRKKAQKAQKKTEEK